MKMPNPIGTKIGRLISFFLLYMTEGIPYGFAVIALLTQLRRADIPQDQLGAFSAMILLPWSFKWVMGPFVDLISFGKLGHRKAWILICHVLMCGTLILCIPITASLFEKRDDYNEAKKTLASEVGNADDVVGATPQEDDPDETQAAPSVETPQERLLKDYLADLSPSMILLTVVFVIHNWFAATQDVAIDALAVSVLKADERGLANGMMFAGSYMGQAVGGSLVLMMMDDVPWLSGGIKIQFQHMYWFVAAGILFVTVFVVIPLREQARKTTAERKASIGSEISSYSKTAFKAVFNNRNGVIAFCMAVLPAGALALSKELQTVLGVDLGLSNGQLGELTLVATVVSAVGCVIGGFLSDRLGRRSMLTVYILMSSIPTMWLAFEMQAVGWTATKPPSVDAIPPVIQAFWLAVAMHALFQGLIYGTRFAVFMDVTNPAVAGTQFTAYMALGNVVLSYTAYWQGVAITNLGYANTLLIDCGVSLFYIMLLPFLVPASKSLQEPGSQPTENDVAV